MAGITKQEMTNRKIAKSMSKMTPERISKLEDAFAIDATVEEACFYADISTQTFYVWIKRHPKLNDRFTALRNKPVLAARQRVVKGIDENFGNAMDYLQRKRKTEFAIRAEVTGANGVSLNTPVELAPEDRDALTKLKNLLK